MYACERVSQRKLSAVRAEGTGSSGSLLRPCTHCCSCFRCGLAVFTCTHTRAQLSGTETHCRWTDLASHEQVGHLDGEVERAEQRKLWPTV